MANHPTPLTMDEVAERGTLLYETRIRHLIESGNIGRYLAIDVGTGDFAIADKRHDAVAVVRKKNPLAQVWGLRIGHVAAAKFGGGDTREKR